MGFAKADRSRVAGRRRPRQVHLSDRRHREGGEALRRFMNGRSSRTPGPVRDGPRGRIMQLSDAILNRPTEEPPMTECFRGSPRKRAVAADATESCRSNARWVKAFRSPGGHLSRMLSSSRYRGPQSRNRPLRYRRAGPVPRTHRRRTPFSARSRPSITGRQPGQRRTGIPYASIPSGNHLRMGVQKSGSDMRGVPGIAQYKAHFPVPI